MSRLAETLFPSLPLSLCFNLAGRAVPGANYLSSRYLAASPAGMIRMQAQAHLWAQYKDLLLIIKDQIPHL